MNSSRGITRIAVYRLTVMAVIFSFCPVHVEAQSSGSGSSGSNQFSTGNSGSGSATGSSSRTGASTSGTSSSANNRTSAGTVTSSAGDGNQESRAAQTFVGGNQSQGFVGGAREAAAAANANRQFRAINDQNSGMNQPPQQSGTPRQRPVALRVGFSFPPLLNTSAGTLDSVNSASMTPFLALRPELQSVSVAVTENGIAILTGTAATAETRRLAGNLIRHQPGIRGVENRIEVNPADSDSQP